MNVAVPCAVILSAMLVAGQARDKKKIESLPPVPWEVVSGKTHVQRLSRVAKTEQEFVTLTWTNAPSAFASNYVSRVIRTVDFATWEEVVRVPYEPKSSVTISNEPLVAFYRIANTIKP